MSADETALLLARVDERVEQLHKAVLGNGQPGAVQRIEALESWRSKLIGAGKVMLAIASALITLGGVVLAARLAG